MTLATVPRYDSSRIAEGDGHAIVVGASVAGLCAARVLADSFEDVTILDRDALPDEPVARRGTPQARQPHILWEAGRATLEDLFPGYSEALLANGAVRIDGRTEFRNFSEGAFLATGTEPFDVYSATRPLYEQLVRRRVGALENVDVREECQLIDYLSDDVTRAVEGVLVRERDGGQRELRADLVVDATGRTSRTPAWLEDHGYAPPRLDELFVNVAYSTLFLDRPADDHRTVGVLADAPRTRGGLAAPVEGDRWLINLHGVHGDHPPTDVDGFVEFAGSLPTPEVKRLLEEYPRDDDGISHYPFPANRRYRYEELDEFPEGLLVIGDAVASFNPIYGQGMSVAALEALVLHHALASDDRETLAVRFFAGVDDVVDTAWMMATGADFGFEQTEGPRPRGTAVFNWYLSRLFRRAHTDGSLTDAFNRVLSMQQPPTSLMRPGIAWRVLKPTR